MVYISSYKPVYNHRYITQLIKKKNKPVLASRCFTRPVYHTQYSDSQELFVRFSVNGVPKMLYYKEYFQNPSPDEGKWRRFYFEMVFSWNIFPKYFAS